MSSIRIKNCGLFRHLVSKFSAFGHRPMSLINIETNAGLEAHHIRLIQYLLELEFCNSSEQKATNEWKLKVMDVEQNTVNGIISVFPLRNKACSDISSSSYNRNEILRVADKQKDNLWLLLRMISFAKEMFLVLAIWMGKCYTFG